MINGPEKTYNTLSDVIGWGRKDIPNLLSRRERIETGDKVSIHQFEGRKERGEEKGNKITF
jgi:hypothetical protein